ncbi:MAG: hypothetical protein P4N60_04220 [Verrucomicrobiae bacterium]|nr:hypothetical protein [Verrucomicrobiae bacterium]
MTQEFYALGNDRTACNIRAFLDHFAPKRESCCEDYPVPESSGTPAFVFKTEGEILKYLEAHPDESYAIYWNHQGSSLNQAMVFYTRDGNVIFGLAEESETPDRRLQELAEYVGAKHALMGSEQPPPSTSREFVALCKKAIKK